MIVINATSASVTSANSKLVKKCQKKRCELEKELKVCKGKKFSHKRRLLNGQIYEMQNLIDLHKCPITRMQSINQLAYEIERLSKLRCEAVGKENARKRHGLNAKLKKLEELHQSFVRQDSLLEETIDEDNEETQELLGKSEPDNDVGEIKDAASEIKDTESAPSEITENVEQEIEKSAEPCDINTLQYYYESIDIVRSETGSEEANDHPDILSPTILPMKSHENSVGIVEIGHVDIGHNTCTNPNNWDVISVGEPEILGVTKEEIFLDNPKSEMIYVETAALIEDEELSIEEGEADYWCCSSVSMWLSTC